MTHPLEPILRPRAVAVIGASRDPRKRGHQVVRSLLESEFHGEVHPVHPKGGKLHGLPVARSIEQLPAAVDLAYLAIPAAGVPAALESCALAGLRGAVVPAVGFSEAGEAGQALEARVRQIARRTGLRVIGPNTSGILNTSIGLNLVGVRDVRAGRLAMLAQSGNVALDLMNEASRRGQGISIYVGIGNGADLQLHECLEFLGSDPETGTIAIYLEGLKGGRRFLGAARSITARTPVVVLRGGRSVAGRRAARSHTGAVAGPYPIFRAAARRAGITEVGRSDELLSVARALAEQPAVPAGRSVAILADGGGHGTLAADRLERLAVPLSRLSVDTAARLRRLLGPAASVTNPVDLAGAADRDLDVFAAALEILSADPEVGGVLVVGLFGGYAIRFEASLATQEADVARDLCRIANRAGFPLVVHSLYAEANSAPLRRLREAGVPVSHSLEVAARSLCALHHRGHLGVDLSPHSSAGVDAEWRARSDVGPDSQAARSMSEIEARTRLGEHGLPLVPATFCRTEEELAAAADELAGPAAVKLVSAELTHKSDAGAVTLNVVGADEAVAAYRRSIDSVREYGRRFERDIEVQGALVSPMLPPPVAELLVGVVRDPSFGEVLTVGAGGLAVELFDDVATRLLPVEPGEVEEMIRELRLAPLLLGHRGRPPADLAAVGRVALALAEASSSMPEAVALELNPLFAYPDSAIAVDARVVLGEV